MEFGDELTIDLCESAITLSFAPLSIDALSIDALSIDAPFRSRNRQPFEFCDQTENDAVQTHDAFFQIGIIASIRIIARLLRRSLRLEMIWRVNVHSALITVFFEGTSPLQSVEFQSRDSGEDGSENGDGEEEEDDQELEPSNREGRIPT